MNCPQCNAWSRVVQTRMPRRVRECGNLHRFTTEEVLVHTHEDKKKEQEARQREVAMAEGTIQSVADYYNADTKSVRAWRKKYRSRDDTEEKTMAVPLAGVQAPKAGGTNPRKA